MQRTEEGESGRQRGRMRLRRSDMSNIERARARTIKMSITIVAAFIWCWTPYVVMTMWYMFDRASAETVDSRLQDGLFLMAVSNSCVNPLVYGSYAVDRRRCCSWCCLFFSSNHGRQDSNVPPCHILQPSDVQSNGKRSINNNNSINNKSLVGIMVTRNSHVTEQYGRCPHHRTCPRLVGRSRPVSEYYAKVNVEYSKFLEFHSDPGCRSVSYVLHSQR